MWNRMLTHCAELPLREVLFQSLVFGLGCELLTCWARFGLGLVSTRDTSWLGAVTFGLRVHHGYVGVLLWLAAWALPIGTGWKHVGYMIGLGLAWSDVIHHFAVLWPLTGSPQFDFFYQR